MRRMLATEAHGRLALAYKGRRVHAPRFRTGLWIFFCNMHFLEYAVMTCLLFHIRALVC